MKAPSRTRRFAVDVAVLLTAYTLQGAANLLPSVVIGRRLGAALLGVFAFALSAARVGYSAAELGLASHLTRLVAREPSSAASYFNLFQSLRALTIPVIVLLVVCASPFHGGVQLICIALVVFASGVVTIQSLFDALFVGHGRSNAVMKLTILASAPLAIACVAWFALRASLFAFCCLFATATLGGVLSWTAATRVSFGFWPRVSWDVATLRKQLRESVPIGLSALMAIATLKAPVLVLSATRPAQEVGCYAVADTFVTACGIFQVAVSAVAYPRLSAAHFESAQRFRKLVWISNLMVISGGMVAATVLAFAGRPIISLIFPSKEFSQLWPILPTIAWSIPSYLFAHHNIYIFAAADRQRHNVFIMAIWFISVFALQIALAPSLGLRGAAWGLLVGRSLGALAIVVAYIWVPFRCSDLADRIGLSIEKPNISGSA